MESHCGGECIVKTRDEKKAKVSGRESVSTYVRGRKNKIKDRPKGPSDQGGKTGHCLLPCLKADRIF